VIVPNAVQQISTSSAHINVLLVFVQITTCIYFVVPHQVM